MKVLIQTLLCVLVFNLSSYAVTYDIPHNGLADHGQADVTGTIAWYMSTYGNNHTYRLSSNADYHTSKTLTVRTGATLTVAANITATIKAVGNSSSQVYDNALVVVQNGAKLLGREGHYNSLTINANRLARVGIDVRYSTNSVISDCTVIDTLNTYTTSGMRLQHLIDGDWTTNLTVNHCYLRNAGYPALNFDSYDSVARGINVCNSTNPKVKYCDIAYTMGSSVAIAETVGAEIEHNILEYSGRCNAVYGKSYSEDSVIGYHNTGATAGVDKRCYIRYNLIRHYGNHGIHVSGKGFHIDYNEVYDGAYYAIYLGDWRTPDTECSGYSTVTYNYVGVGSGTTYSLYFNPYIAGTINTTGNTGQVVTYWGALCENLPEVSFPIDHIAYERTQPITIDGVINAGEWEQAVHLKMKYPDIVNAPYNGSLPLEPTFQGFFAPVNAADLSADVYAAWDIDNFYFAVRVYDDTTLFTGDPANVNDEVQLLFNPGLGVGDYRLQNSGATIIQIAPDGSGGTYIYSRVSGFNEPNAIAASTVLSDGYVIEFKYPWKNCLTFAKKSPNYGDSIRVSWVLADDLLSAEKTLMCDSSGSGRSWAMQSVETWNNFRMVSSTGCGIKGIIRGDINRNCSVGLDDLSLIVEQWLECSDPQMTGCLKM